MPGSFLQRLLAKIGLWKHMSKSKKVPGGTLLPPQTPSDVQEFDPISKDLDSHLQFIDSPDAKQLIKSLLISGVMTALHETFSDAQRADNEGLAQELSPFCKKSAQYTLWSQWHTLKHLAKSKELRSFMDAVPAYLLDCFRQGQWALVSLGSQTETNLSAEALSHYVSMIKNPKYRETLDELRSLGQRFLLGDSTDLISGKKVICADNWVEDPKKNLGLVSLALVYECAGLNIADGVCPESFVSQASSQLLLTILEEADNADLDLFILVTALQEYPFWRMLVSPKRKLLLANFNQASSFLWRIGLRLSPTRLADFFAKQMHAATMRNSTIKFVHDLLVDPQQTKLQDEFIATWNQMRLIHARNIASFPQAHHVLCAMMDQESAQILRARLKKNRAPRKRKQGYQNHHRVRRSGFDTLSLQDTHLHEISSILEKNLAKLINQHGLGLSPPKTAWSRAADAHIIMDLERNLLVMPVGVLDYAWEMQKELLKWSIAIKLAEIYFNEGQDRTRELSFKLAAERMALAPSFLQPEPVLKAMPQHWRDLEETLSHAEQRIIRKVSKLFALSQSENEAEAALAMERAQDLISQHNLSNYSSRSSTEQRSDLIKLTLYLDRKETSPIIDKISGILKTHYFVHIVTDYALCPKNLDYHATVELIGRRHNVLFAEHVFDFLMYKVQGLWKQAAKDRGLKAEKRLSFQLGLLEGFAAKLQAIAKRQSPQFKTCFGLIPLEKQSLDDFVSRLYPSLKARSIRSHSVDPSVYQVGKTEGSNLQINQPINTSRSQSDGQFYLR